MYPRFLLGPERQMQNQGGQGVRSFKVAAVLLAMVLLASACGARLSKNQLALAAASGGQRLTAGGGTDTGGAGGEAAGGTSVGGGGAGGGSAGGGTSAAGGT